MHLQFHPIVVVYFFSCAIALFMAALSRRIPSVRSSGVWGLVMVSCAVWSFGDGMETLVTDLFWKLIFIRISYIGVIGTAVFWSAFIIIYSNNERLLTGKTKLILSILPVITLFSVCSLHLHPYFYTSVGLVTVDGHVSLSLTYGPLFKVWAVYAYCAIFGSGVLLIQAVLRFPQHFHGQIYVLTTAALMPLVSNFLYITGHNFLAPFDPSAPAFVISGLLVSLNFRRYKFLDIVPVAHDLVFRDVNSGVIVLDGRGIVLALNPAAEKMTGAFQGDVIGKTLAQAGLDTFSPDRWIVDRQMPTTEVRADASVYEVQVTPMTDRTGRPSGQILLLYDITLLKQSEKELSDAYARLQEIAATDALTGLFNRRNFFDLVQKALSMAKRGQLSFSLILIDLDEFKAVNDTKGHVRGDEVLKETAKSLKLHSRDGDILGRYGGDEFVVLAYEADNGQAEILAQRFCTGISARLAEIEDMDITLSIGIAFCARGEDMAVDTLLERADLALYEAKTAGRNQAAVWNG